MNAGDYTTEIMAGVHLVTQQRNYSLENPNLPLNDPEIWDAVFGGGSRAETGETITADKALTYGPFWHAVSLISGDVARLPLHIYKRRHDLGDDARERDREHPLGRVLGVAANPETESVKFWGRLMADALVWRHGYAWIARDGMGRPAELYNLLPDRTRAERIKGRLVYITEANGGDGAYLQPIMPEDILHIEGLNVGGASGAAVFQMARNAIGLGLAQEKFGAKFFKHGGRAGGILELPIGMPKPARDNVEEGFRKTYEGADNPFKTIVLRDNAKFHSAQQSPRDSQMVEATDAQTRQIAHWFNLMPSKLGLSDSVSYNSKAEDNQAYLDSTLAIWLTRIAAACNFRLLDENEQSTHFVEHNTASLLRMNMLAMSQAFQILVAARVMNPNECRAKLNMLPYDGGEEFVNPNTMKSGDDTQPKEDEPKEDEPKPQRSAEYLRTLFNITARAREKAKKTDAFMSWVDGDLAPHRTDWKALSADPFPFESILVGFRQLTATATATALPTAVDDLCLTYERNEAA
jgi:HK97 family phage portal protein